MASSSLHSTSTSAQAAAVEELSSRIFGELHIDSDGQDGNGVDDIDWERTAGLAERCAGSLRNEEARTIWAQGQLIPVCGQLLEIGYAKKEATNCMTQCCRVIGNIVLDHPANRTKCIVAKVPQRILKLLEELLQDTASTRPEQILCLKAATGALLNLSIDTPDIKKLLVDLNATDTVSKALALHSVGIWPSETDTQTRATLVEWSTKLLQELLADEKRIPRSTTLALASAILALPLPSTPDFDNSSALAASLSAEAVYTLLSSDLSILSTACEILEPASYEDESLQEALAFPLTGSTSLLSQMLDFVEFAEILPSWLPIVKQESTAGESALEEDGESLEVEQTFSNIKAEVARIAIAVCSNDKVMNKAFEASEESSDSMAWVVERCTKWLKSGRADLIISGSTMLANLARKDSHCVKLVHQYSLAEILSALLNTYAFPPTSATPTTSRPGESTQILHGVTGLLKNLSIPGANKQILSDSNIIESCVLLLRPSLDMVLPLQNAAVGTVKHLCAGNVASALKLILPPLEPGQTSIISLAPSDAAPLESDTTSSPLDTVLNLIARTNDVRLKCEATRLLGNVIRSLYSARSVTSPITPSALGGLETGIAKARARQILERSEGTVEALSEMLRTGQKYPVLVNEAIVALTLLSTTENGASMALHAITKQHETVSEPPATEATSSTIPTLTPASDLSAPSPPAARTNGYSSTPGSRSNSLNNRSAPATALHILLRWLTEYSIQAATMPVEMAGNALSLIEGVVRSSAAKNDESAREKLRVEELKSALEGVNGRKAESGSEKAVQEAAGRTLAFLETLA